MVPRCYVPPKHMRIHRTHNTRTTELTVATPDWEEATATATVIDIDEFEAAHDDPKWLAFCEAADRYVAASMKRELQAT